MCVLHLYTTRHATREHDGAGGQSANVKTGVEDDEGAVSNSVLVWCKPAHWSIMHMVSTKRVAAPAPNKLNLVLL